MLHRPAPAPDEEQGILYPQSLHRDSPAAPSGSAHMPRPHGVLSMPAESQGLATESLLAYSSLQPLVSQQMSPQLRSSLPVLAERSSMAGQQGHLPAMASMPVEAQAQLHGAVLMSPLAAARLPTAQRDDRVPLDTQSHPSTLRTDASWQSLLAADSAMGTSTAATHQQQQELQQGHTTTAGASEEAGAASGALPDLAMRHKRSASGQEQGLAMAEQVISAYNLGMKLPSALEQEWPGRPLPSTAPSLTSKILSSPPRLAEATMPAPGTRTGDSSCKYGQAVNLG